MSSETDDDGKSFYSKEGLRLRAITPDEFKEDMPHALTRLQLEENVIYEARGYSKRLEKVGAAVSFNVIARNLDPIHPNLATRGFMLMTLDDDFQVVSAHKATIRQDRMIENAPITIRPQRALLLGAQIHRSYLVSNNDTTLDTILSTSSSIDEYSDDSALASV